MSLNDLLLVMQSFFFGEVSLLGVAALRICIALVVLVDVITISTQRHLWYSPDGVLPEQRWRAIVRHRYLSLFHFLPPSRRTTDAMIVLTAVAAVAVGLGVALPYCTLALFVLLTSLHHRNFHILYGGDSVLRLMLFLLCFAPVDGLTIEHYLCHRAWSLEATGVAWPLRLMQIQLCIIYWYALIHKTNKPSWQGGTALYYPLNNFAFRHMPLPAFCRTPMFSRIATPCVVLTEALLPIAAWFEETRLAAVGLGVAFHIALGYSLSLHLFGPIMMACWLVFLSPTTSMTQGDFAATDIGAVLLISGFIGFSVFWDDPHRGYVHYWLQRYGRRLVQTLGLHHSWPLFAGDPPARAWGRVEVVVHVRGRTIGLDWRFGHLVERGGEILAPRFQHRFRKFEEALTKGHPLLRRAFLAHVREQIVQRYGEPDAVAVFKSFHPSVPFEGSPTSPDIRMTLLSSDGTPAPTWAGQETDWWCYAWNLARAGQSLPDVAEIALVAAVELCGSGRDPTPALVRLKWVTDRAPAALRSDTRDPLHGLVQSRLHGAERGRYTALITMLTLGHVDEQTAAWWSSMPSTPLWEPWLSEGPSPAIERNFP